MREMTNEEYFSKHIPHRINLLITFRERFCSSNSHASLSPSEVWEFYRCSKDIGILMVRFLLGELGIYVAKGTTEVSESTTKRKHGIQRLTKNDIENDPRRNNIIQILVAGNRVIAHMDDFELEQPATIDYDNTVLLDVINFTEEKIISQMYEATGRQYEDHMSEIEHEMQRKKMLIQE